MKTTDFKKWNLVKGQGNANPNAGLTFTIPAGELDLNNNYGFTPELPSYVHLIGIWQEPNTDYDGLNEMERNSPTPPNTCKLEYYWGAMVQFSVPNYSSALALLQYMVKELQTYWANNKGNLPTWDEPADTLMAYWDFVQCYLHALHLFTLTLKGGEAHAQALIRPLANSLNELASQYEEETQEYIGQEYNFNREATLTYLWRDEEYPRVTINQAI